jgi:putative transcriptional regulator
MNVGSSVIYVELKSVILKKQLAWGRTITITEIADASGISRMTLHRMLKDQTYNASTDHLNKLCAYLQCDLYELIRWEADVPVPQENVA